MILKMEPHKQLDGIESWKPSTDAGAQEYFNKARLFAENFYSAEIKQIASVKLEDTKPEAFFYEYVWVVHATGFSARAVGNLMPRLTDAYGPWEKLGWEDLHDVLARVCPVVNNPQKIRAVHTMALTMCGKMQTQSWSEYREQSLSTPEKLQSLPYIGKVTCYHLARNIGILECVKPDLHLVRLADHWGYGSCEEMCKAVRPEGTPLGIVDLILWYAASTFGTLDVRKDGSR